jgi:hypothetical protein
MFCKATSGSRAWQLTPMTLAIYEAKIRRIMVAGQPGQKIKNSQTTYQWKKLGVMAFVCPPRRVKKQDPISKTT